MPETTTSGKELLLTAIRGGQTPRPPWVPFVGVHGAFLVEKNAAAYLQSSELIVAGLQRAAEHYEPDGLPVVFDLQLEAEVLGCQLVWPEDGPPSVASHPLETDRLEDLPPFDTTKGRFPVVAEALRELKQGIGQHTALYGLITGPFTLALHLRGSEIFLDLMLNPEGVRELLSYCADVARQTASFYLDHGADVIAVVDPMTSQISPEHFTEFIAPPLDVIFDAIRDNGGLSSLFVCGDATRNLEAMCQTRCDNVSIDENISLEYVRDLARAHGKSFGGNLRLTVSLLLGTELDAKKDAVRCIDLAGDTGFVLAPGCDLPYNTPARNVAPPA